MHQRCPHKAVSKLNLSTTLERSVYLFDVELSCYCICIFSFFFFTSVSTTKTSYSTSLLTLLSAKKTFKDRSVSKTNEIDSIDLPQSRPLYPSLKRMIVFTFTLLAEFSFYLLATYSPPPSPCKDLVPRTITPSEKARFIRHRSHTALSPSPSPLKLTRKPKSLASPPCGHIDATEPVGGSGKQGGNIAVTQQHRFYRKHHLLEQPLVGLFYRPDDRWSALAPVDQIRSVTGPALARTAGNCGRWSMAFVVSESHGKTRTIRTMTRRLVDTKRHTVAEREREQRVCRAFASACPSVTQKLKAEMDG